MYTTYNKFNGIFNIPLMKFLFQLTNIYLFSFVSLSEVYIYLNVCISFSYIYAIFYLQIFCYSFYFHYLYKHDLYRLCFRRTKKALTKTCLTFLIFFFFFMSSSQFLIGKIYTLPYPGDSTNICDNLILG